MEQYENLMKLFRNECQYAGAARTLAEGKACKMLNLRLNSLLCRFEPCPLHCRR